MLMTLRKTLKRKDNQKGFTLVELIIVMAILAILAAIAVPRFGASLNNAKEQANNANIMMIEKATELAVLNGDVTETTEDVLDTLVQKGYLDQAPTNPVNDFEYIVSIDITAGAGDITDQLEITVQDAPAGGGE